MDFSASLRLCVSAFEENLQPHSHEAGGCENAWLMLHSQVVSGVYPRRVRGVNADQEVADEGI